MLGDGSLNPADVPIKLAAEEVARVHANGIEEGGFAGCVAEFLDERNRIAVHQRSRMRSSIWCSPSIWAGAEDQGGEAGDGLLRFAGGPALAGPGGGPASPGT